MKVYILSDLEGVACVFSRREGYVNAMEYGTMELVAVCEKLLANGVDDILINCFHQLEFHKFPRQVRFFHSEPSHDFFTPCLDETFDFAMITGMHAMSGGPVDRGCWRHTITPPPLTRAYSAIDEISLNGVAVGETGLFAAFAGTKNVPVVYLSGDQWACEEAEALIPGIVTCAVKKGASFYSALSLHPAEAAARSADAALNALNNFKKIKPYVIDGALDVRVRFGHAHRASDSMVTIKNAKRIDEYTIEINYENMVQFMDDIGCMRAPEDALHQRDLGFERVTGIMTRYGSEPYLAHPGFDYPRQKDFFSAE